jgi:hypothetical protein
LIFVPDEHAKKRHPRPQVNRKLKRVSPSLSKRANRDDPSTRNATPARPSRSLSWPLLDVLSFVIRSFSPVTGTGSSPPNLDLSPSRICGAWIEVLPHLSWSEKGENVLAPTIRTLALAMLAQEPHHLVPVSEALEARVEALRSLRSGLRECDGKSSNALLASIMCLFLAEVILVTKELLTKRSSLIKSSQLLLPTLGSGAMIHAKGVEDLMNLYTPSSYTSGVSHQLFVGFRPIFVRLISIQPHKILLNVFQR